MGLMLTLKQKLRPYLYRLKHQFLTTRNLIRLVAGVVALSSVLSSVTAINENYSLQKRVDRHRQRLAVLKLETEALEIEKDYYKSAEYQELAVRQSLGLGASDEKVLILPPYSSWVKQKQAEHSVRESQPPKISNLNQWINFLFGGSRRGRH